VKTVARICTGYVDENEESKISVGKVNKDKVNKEHQYL
jgi:hypothetical protein